MDLRSLRKLIAPLNRRIHLLIGRCVLTAISDSGTMQRVQISGLRGELHDDVERFQNYGFTGVPLAGAEAVVVFQAGNRDHGIAVVVDDRRHRKNELSGGEVAMYDYLGKFIHMKADGTLHVSAPKILFDADTSIILNAPRIEQNAEDDLRHYAGVSHRLDVGGYATQLEFVSGTTWKNTSWTTGATLATPVTNAIEPPKVDDA